MSMQPYQPKSIEHQKQQVRKDARTTAIALGVTVVALPIALFASSFFTVVAIIAGIVTIYNGNSTDPAAAGTARLWPRGRRRSSAPIRPCRLSRDAAPRP